MGQTLIPHPSSLRGTAKHARRNKILNHKGRVGGELEGNTELLQESRSHLKNHYNHGNTRNHTEILE